MEVNGSFAVFKLMKNIYPHLIHIALDVSRLDCNFENDF